MIQRLYYSSMTRYGKLVLQLRIAKTFQNVMKQMEMKTENAGNALEKISDAKKVTSKRN